MAKKNPFDEIADFRADAHKGLVDLDATLTKNYACDQVKLIDEKKRQIKFIISTATVDRMGDTIAVEGWDLKAFKKSPVVLFAHDSRSLPIAKASKIKKEDGVLKATAEFATREMNEFADSVFQMYLGGFMRAVSVGFRPTEWKFVDDDDKRPFGIDFTRQELLEFSAVPIPANPEALIDAKAAGIDLIPLKNWAEKILDQWTEHKGLALPRKTIEDIRKQAADQKKVYLPSPTEQDDLLRKNLAAITETSVEGLPVTTDTVVLDETAQVSTLVATNEDSSDALNDAEEVKVAVAGDQGAVDTLIDGIIDKLVESNVISNMDDEEDEEDDDESEYDFKGLLSTLVQDVDVLLENLSEEAKGDFLESRANRRALKCAMECFFDGAKALMGVLEPFEDAEDVKPKRKTVKLKSSKKQMWEDEDVLLSFRDDTEEEEEPNLEDISEEDIQIAIKEAVVEAFSGNLLADEVRKRIKDSAGKT